MSVHEHTKRKSVPHIQTMKGKEPIVALTAHSAPVASIMDPYVDLIIVGDSVGMVAYGFESTLAVTLEMMINHGAAVVRSTHSACVVVDLPYATYQESKEIAYRNASQTLIKSGAQAVKMEGGSELVETVEFLVQRGIPVMPHIGLMPQHTHVMGGFKVQGKNQNAINALKHSAKLFEQAGAFSLLIEGVHINAADQITESISIPTIGIGASPNCDGQVLVTEDLLGLCTEYTPSFAKQYVDLAQPMEQAFCRFQQEVKQRQFPTPDHCFGVKA